MNKFKINFYVLISLILFNLIFISPIHAKTMLKGNHKIEVKNNIDFNLRVQ